MTTFEMETPTPAPAAAPPIVPDSRPPAQETPLKIRVADFNFYYGTAKVLHGITLDIPERRVTALIGPSGCGKSTFIRSINRMNDIIPDARAEGTIEIDGRNIYGPGMDVVALRRSVGMVFQKSNPFPKSIYDNVAYGLRIGGMHNKRALGDMVRKSLIRAALWDEVKDRLHSSALALSGSGLLYTSAPAWALYHVNSFAEISGPSRQNSCGPTPAFASGSMLNEASTA